MEGGGSGEWTHLYFDEGEGEGRAEEGKDNHGDSLCHIHFQILITSA